MNKQIFIINGTAGSGKDSFVKAIKSVLKSRYKYTADNYSSVARVKEIMMECGWNGSKTEKDRKFMSDLKLLFTEYNDLPFKDMQYIASNFKYNSPENEIFLFIHIREPKEIARAVKEFDAISVLVKNDSVEHITSNMADANVYNYDYDIVINNNGSLEDLEKKAELFIYDYINNDLKKEY